jgi:hypothetical protein
VETDFVWNAFSMSTESTQFSTDTNKQSTFSMETGDHRRCRANKNMECRVEEGSNTSTVTIRVVGGDEKGSLESQTVKYGLESHGTRTTK